jgi:short-subunit dehydrogenase
MIKKQVNIVITGATSPLGAEFVRWSLSKRYNVIALSRRRTQELEDLLYAGKVVKNELIIADLGNQNEIKKAVYQIEKKCGHVDILVNNASGWHEGGLQATPIDEIYKQVNSSIGGTMALTKMMIPMLISASNPCIVNICSTVGTGYRFSPNTLYVAMKGALESFGRSLRNDLGNDGIRITNIHLGKLEDGEPAEKPRIPLKDVTSALEYIISASSNTSVDNISLTPAQYYY